MKTVFILLFTCLTLTACASAEQKTDSFAMNFTGNYSDVRLQDDGFMVIPKTNASLAKQAERQISEADELLKLEPKNTEAYVRRAEGYSAQGNWEQALSDTSSAIAINPYYGEAYAARGIIYLTKRNNDQAILEFNEAIKFKPKCEDAHGGLAIAYFNKRDYDRAWEAVHRAEDLKMQLNHNFLTALQRASGRKK